MYNIIYFCSLLLILLEGVFCQKCNDCTNYDSCPPALDLALHQRTPKTLQLFQAASCGFDLTNSPPIVKVCCSMFSTSDKSGDETDTPEDIRIANHKNLNLLPDDCGDIKGDRIIGGTIADMYEFPWMALISHNTSIGIFFKCGGTIINKRYVLTAAHCVKNKKLAGVRVGEYDIYNDIDCQNGVCEKHIQDIPISSTVIHKDYKSMRNKVVNDIALIRLADDVDFNHRNVHRICLPKTSKLRRRAFNNLNAEVTGWGVTEDGTESSVLLKVTIPIFTAEECSGIYDRFAEHERLDVTSEQLCGGDRDKDSCAGDSGGPLMIEEKVNNVDRYVQYGIVSHGPAACGMGGKPGVYTDVTKYMGWILDNIY